MNVLNEGSELLRQKTYVWVLLSSDVYTLENLLSPLETPASLYLMEEAVPDWNDFALNLFMKHLSNLY